MYVVADVVAGVSLRMIVPVPFIAHLEKLYSLPYLPVIGTFVPKAVPPRYNCVTAYEAPPVPGQIVHALTEAIAKIDEDEDVGVIVADKLIGTRVVELLILTNPVDVPETTCTILPKDAGNDAERAEIL